MSNDSTPVLSISAALLETLKLVLACYFPAAILSAGLGFLVSLNRSVYRVFQRLVAIPLVIPAIALFPLALARFEQAYPALVFVVTFGAFWMMLMHLSLGFRHLQTDAVFRKPGIQTITMGLRTGLVLVWGVAIAGEMLAAGTNGLGFYLWDAYQRNALAEVVNGVVAIAVVAFLLDQLLDGLGTVLIRIFARKQ